MFDAGSVSRIGIDSEHNGRAVAILHNKISDEYMLMLQPIKLVELLARDNWKIYPTRLILVCWKAFGVQICPCRHYF